MKFFNCLLIAFFTVISVSVFAQNNKPYLIVGTYNSAISDGIYVYQFDEKTGDMKKISHVPTSNASYVTVSPSGNYIYAVNENGNKDNTGGAVSAFSFDKKNGQLQWINKVSSQGNDPCYIDIDHSGKWLSVANYSGGSMSVLPVKSDGAVGTVVSQVQHYGKGPNNDRQEKPHVHYAAFTNNNKYIAVNDLGIDQVALYPIHLTTGAIDEADAIKVKTKPGAGPRHIAFHPTKNFMYLIEELSASVAVYKLSKNKLVLK
ncbi:MAG: lactonase family protein, partial [Chitinophagaceae bacterium]